MGRLKTEKVENWKGWKLRLADDADDDGGSSFLSNILKILTGPGIGIWLIFIWQSLFNCHEVTRHHDQSNSHQEKHLTGGLQFQWLSSLSSCMTWMELEEWQSSSTGWEKKTGPGIGCWNVNALSQWLTSSDRPHHLILLNPSNSSTCQGPRIQICEPIGVVRSGGFSVKLPQVVKNILNIWGCRQYV